MGERETTVEPGSTQHGTLDEALTRLWRSDPESIAGSAALWRRLHDEAPIHWFGDELLIARHADLRQVLLKAYDWVNKGGTRGNALEAINALLGDEDRKNLAKLMEFDDLILGRTDDRERHKRLRKITAPMFTPRRIAQLQEATESYTAEMLDPLEGADVYDLAPACVELPLLVIGSLLGVPREDLQMIRVWSERLAGSTQRMPPNPAAIRDGLAAIDDFRRYIDELIDRQGRNPAEASAFGAEMLDAERSGIVSRDEITATFIIFLFAGHETTSNLLSIGVAELQRHRDQWELLAQDPSLAVGATDELLRIVSPAQFGWLHARTDFELGGVNVSEGDTLAVMIGAANRDPLVFSDPDRVDITRPNARDHLALGQGPRYCIGQALAKMEGRIFFGELARRFPELELAVDELEWQGPSMLRRLAALPVSPGPARAAAA